MDCNRTFATPFAPCGRHPGLPLSPCSRWPSAPAPAPAVFSVVNGVLLRALPYPNGNRVVRLTQPSARNRGADGRFSLIEIGDFSAGTRSLDAVAEYHSMPFQLYGRGEPQRVQTGVVSDVFFDILGVQPLLGRLFKQGEDAIGAPPMVVLSYRYWRERLGGDPTVIWCPCSSRS